MRKPYIFALCLALWGFLIPHLTYAYSATPANNTACSNSSNCASNLFAKSTSASGTPYWIGNSQSTTYVLTPGAVFPASSYIYRVAQATTPSNFTRDCNGTFRGNNGTVTGSFTDSDGTTISITRFDISSQFINCVEWDGDFLAGKFYAVLTDASSTLSFASESAFNTYITTNTGSTTATTTGSGAILGACGTLDLPCLLSNVAQYLFIPSADALNQFSSLSTNLGTKFPFSYVASTTAVWQGLVASTTLNAPSYAFNYASIDPASTTPMGSIMPTFTGFSSSTVLRYFPSSAFDLLKALAAIAILVTLIADIFFSARNLLNS